MWPVHWPSPKWGGQQTRTRRKKKKNTAATQDCLALPRRSLSIVTAMSSRNVIQHYMRLDTGGLLVWHIRDMLRINMQWCQLKAWNALRGGSNVFPAHKQPETKWRRTYDGFLSHCLHEVCACLCELIISSKRKFWVGDYWVGRWFTRCMLSTTEVMLQKYFFTYSLE